MANDGLYDKVLSGQAWAETLPIPRSRRVGAALAAELAARNSL